MKIYTLRAQCSKFVMLLKKNSLHLAVDAVVVAVADPTKMDVVMAIAAKAVATTVNVVVAKKRKKLILAGADVTNPFPVQLYRIIQMDIMQLTLLDIHFYFEIIRLNNRND